MSTYRVEWPCGEATETDCWQPTECPICEADKLRAEVLRLREQVANLRACLKWYVEKGGVQEGGRWEGSNDYWIKGKCRAIAVLEETTLSPTVIPT